MDLLQRIKIWWLLSHNPPRLFERLYQQDWYRGLHEEWLDQLNIRQPTRLLEIGCGPGLLAKSAACRGAYVHAVDTSQKMLVAAQRNTYQTESLALVQSSAADLPYADDTFDCVIAASLINLLKQPEEALAEMCRVTRPNGRVSFLVPSDNMCAINANNVITRFHLKGFSAEALRTWSRLSSKFTRNRCLSLMIAAGFKDSEISTALDGMVYIASGSKI